MLKIILLVIISPVVIFFLTIILGITLTNMAEALYPTTGFEGFAVLANMLIPSFIFVLLIILLLLKYLLHSLKVSVLILISSVIIIFLLLYLYWLNTFKTSETDLTTQQASVTAQNLAQYRSIKIWDLIISVDGPQNNGEVKAYISGSNPNFKPLRMSSRTWIQSGGQCHILNKEASLDWTLIPSKSSTIHQTIPAFNFNNISEETKQQLATQKSGDVIVNVIFEGEKYSTTRANLNPLSFERQRISYSGIETLKNTCPRPEDSLENGVISQTWTLAHWQWDNIFK